MWSAFFALVCLCVLTNSAHAATFQYTNTTDGAVNETATPCGGTWLTRNFSVGTSYTVDDVDIGVLMAHTYRGDLRMRLRSPAGTEVEFFSGTGTGADNFNVLLDDSAASPVSGHSGGDTATAATVVPPYEENFSPAAALTSAFSGQNANGTWRLQICDRFGGDSGTFYQSDLFITEALTDFADLSLNKGVSNSTPANGTNVTYALTVTNSSSSTLTATGITVQDTLPAGLSYVSASGTGSYDDATGVWTVGTLAPNSSASIDIVATVTATSGATIVNSAEISASSVTDSDSTPNNGSSSEDDDDSASLTVSGARVAGIPPNLNLICPPSDQILFDWSGKTWTTGTTNNSYAVADIGTVNFSLTTDVPFVAGAPEINSTNNGGNIGQVSLFVNNNNNSLSDVATSVMTLPTAVPGLQFTIFDIDFLAGQFADKITITGSYNGATVIPTLTNGVANYVVGNTAIGDAGSGGTSPDGNVVVTFSSPVDTVTLVYGNHTTAPANPGNQFMNLYDMNYCRPSADLSVTKLSNIVSDPISGSNPKAIPGATVRYCILISNAGSATATDIDASDNLPADVTYITGSMLTSDGCSGTTTAEDEDATGADETDPFGMSFAAGGTNGTGVVTGTATTLAPGDSLALIFNVTLD